LDELVDTILRFKMEMQKYSADVKAIEFDENTFDLICRYKERECDRSTCSTCPYIKSKIKFLGIDIKKG